MLEHIANIQTSELSYLMFEDQLHLVGPCIMLGEGTWHGSGGEITYSEDVLAQNIQAWNHKPILVNHPSNGTSGCEVPVINKSKIGTIQNTMIQDGKLKSDLYINVKRCKEIAPQILQTVQNKEMLEVSTGLFGTIDNDRNLTSIIPDHLAILPNSTGAYSIEDGAGFPRFNKSGKWGMNDIINQMYKNPNLLQFSNSRGIYLEDLSNDWVVFSFYNYESDEEETYKFKYATNKNGVKLDITSASKVIRKVEYQDVTPEIQNTKEIQMEDTKPEAPQVQVMNTLEEVFNSALVSEVVKSELKEVFDFRKQEHLKAVDAVFNHALNAYEKEDLERFSIAKLQTIKNKLDTLKPEVTETPAAPVVDYSAQNIQNTQEAVTIGKPMISVWGVK